MKKEIYTLTPTPFAIARRFAHIKTIIEEYEVFKCGEHSCLLVKNPCKDLWHCIESTCGAIIGTHKDKSVLQAMVVQDEATGDREVMNKQIEQGKIDCEYATLLDNDKFFSMFEEK